MKLQSIRAKLIGIAMATACLALLLVGVGIAVFEVISSRRQMAREVDTVAAIIGANSTAAITFNDADAAREILSALSLQTDVVQGCLYDDHGKLFSVYQPADAPAPCPPAPQADESQLRGGLMVHSGPVILRHQRVGTLTITVKPGEAIRQLESFGLMLIIVLVIAAFAALVISARLEGKVSRPILALAGTAKRVSEQQDYGLRAPEHTGDETGLAVAAFNLMLERAQAAADALRDANAKSHEQAKFLVSILDNMSEGMVVCDPQGRFLLWNPAATKLVGPQADVAPSQWAEHFGLYTEDGKTLIAADDIPLMCALRGETIEDQEMFVHSAVIPEKWISISARPLLDDEGHVSLAIAVFRDISERKKTESQLRTSEAALRQAQKMEAIGRLAGGVAHDFNNLLTVIYGNTQFVLDQLPQGNPLRPDVEAVEEAAERAAALTRQLLAFSRKQAMEAQPLDLNMVVGTLQKMLVRVIGENIELVSTGPKDLGVIRADLGQIEQVIMNLVVNAHDAMPKGGRLIISTANVDLDEDEAQTHSAKPGPYVMLSVADTGVGMDPETQSHIFEPFFTTKEQGKGTGLGLSTVFGITQQSGGHITVYSEPGHGSTFKIYFPRIVEAAGAGSGRSMVGPAPGGTETILLAEDETPLRTLMGRKLKELGYQVLLASDGLDALAVQQQHQGPIHLVISDVVMPRMGGPELVHRLLPLIPGLRVLFVSGYAAEALTPGEFADAQASYLQKPFTPEALARKVRETLDRVRAQNGGSRKSER